MKKTIVALCCIFLIRGFSTYVIAQGCITIQDGVITYSAAHYLGGQPLMTGFDPYGYNYEAHLFSGSYANAYLGGAGFPPYDGDDEAYLTKNPTVVNQWYWPYRNVDLNMKWNDAWLSNEDCDRDGKLDRHYGYPSYIGSGAWETNHMKDTYLLEGKKCKMVDFVKIIAVPTTANKVGGVWYTATGTEIGPDIWGAFATIEEIYNDPCGGGHGKLYGSPDHAGFGGW